ncbi:hypothetical protein KAR91_73995 [Candidatus Pacearchaeota archaeon]|nr:hypothetical protein [Candidatus Pacearchaeota archaeon]
MDNSKVVCPRCEGNTYINDEGNFAGYDFCPLCGGDGEVDWVTGIMGEPPVVVQAIPNMTHILAGGTTVTLPPAPNEGDVVNIIRGGEHELKIYAGGEWRIVQTGGLNVQNVKVEG